MPTSIPYDHPSLVLGGIVDTNVLDVLDQVANLNQTIDAAQDKMNALIMMKRSFAMTLNELLDMNIDVSNLKAEIKQLDPQISKAASDYMQVRLKNETQIQKVREQLGQIKVNHVESPLDFGRSDIIQKPLAYESMKLDAQYFSFGSSLEDDTLANIESYVKSATSDIGKSSGDMAKQATGQIQQQHSNHSISGTLIITACCMHRNVSLIEPFVLDINKAIAAWNGTAGKADKIDTSNPSALAASNRTPAQKGQSTQSISMISGVAYGSSFVGMVHILNSESSGPAEEQMASLNEKLQLGGWLENTTGGFGVSDSTLQEVKKILSTQQISSHVSLITMGAVPTISSSEVQLGVSQLIKPDPNAINNMISGSETDTVQSGASEAREGNRLLAIQNAKIQSVLQGLDKVDQGSNQVMDVNSLMSAFDNYLQSITSGDSIIGSPVQFYLKKITKSQLVKQWLKKYFTENTSPGPDLVKKVGNQAAN